MGCQPAMRKVKHEPSIDMAKQYYSSGSAFNSPTRHSSHCKDNEEEEQVIPVKKDAPTCLDRRVSLGTITEISGSMGSMIEPAKNFSRTNWYFLLDWLWNVCLILQILIWGLKTIMAAPFSNTQVRVPHGFRNLLWVISREVRMFN